MKSDQDYVPTKHYKVNGIRLKTVILPVPISNESQFRNDQRRKEHDRIMHAFARYKRDSQHSTITVRHTDKTLQRLVRM